MPDPAHALTLQFLAWVAEGPRTYAQAMDAWRSTCPRLSIWEDAILDGLVSFAGGATRNQSRVTLTAKGRALLGSDAPAARAKGTDKGTDQGTDKGIRKEARTPARAALAR
ncbi:MAG TPA: hypothetical protein VKX28_23655 [Xanthobacteraceae bacterium]|nr:hypothetical protein [Xanthobacteraceae bacterium]